MKKSPIKVSTMTVLDGDGRVVGVVSQKEGKPIRLKTEDYLLQEVFKDPLYELIGGSVDGVMWDGGVEVKRSDPMAMSLVARNIMRGTAYKCSEEEEGEE